MTAAEDNPLDITSGGLRNTIRVTILENAHQFAPVVQGIVVGSIIRFGKAGTGAAINGLHGAAKSRAVLAAAGGGPLKDGGAGMAVGEARIGRLAYVPKIIAGGIVFADIVVQVHQEAKADARRADEDGTSQA